MIGRNLSKQVSSGESPKEKHLMIKRKRERHHCGWRADISDYSEYMITFPELLHRLARSAGLVAIIGRKKLQLMTINPTSVVHQTEYGFNPQLHLTTEFFGGARERSSNPEANFLIRDASRSGGDLIGRRWLRRCGTQGAVGRSGIVGKSGTKRRLRTILLQKGRQTCSSG